KFDVVITDLDMPEVDGWAVTAEVKARNPNTPVVMLTGWAGEIAPEDFAKRGVDVVLTKPCSRADLESAITDLLAPKPVSGLDVLVVADEAAFAGSLRGLLTLPRHRGRRYRADHLDELVEIERLRQEAKMLIRAFELRQAAQRLFHVRGAHDHRGELELWPVAQQREHFPAADLGHDHVEHDHVRM